ncbi:MAG TPA: hypothetical protein VIJ57_13665 [Hanamia sp.]
MFFILRWGLEGIPVYDLIWGSEGFRRPGYIISAEPGITYMVNEITLDVAGSGCSGTLPYTKRFW